MRIFFIVAVCLSALTSVSVNAQTPSSTTLSDITREHPEWFTEPDNNYKPCPASVVFPGERHACLGLPEYGRRTSITIYWRPRHWWRRGYF
jgi:hypothetical protein